MSAKLKLNNFEFGTIKITENEVIYTMSKADFSENELDFLREFENPNFLKMSGLEVTDYHVGITYMKPQNLKTLTEIGQEEHLVKLAISQQIVNTAITEQTEYFVSLNPSTIFYYPMSEVKYSYFADENIMPYEKNYSALDRYKALIVSILTKGNYKRCLDGKERISKKSNELVRNIYSAESLSEIQLLLNNATNYVTYQYVTTNRTNIRKVRNKYLIVLFLFLLLGGAAVFYFMQKAEGDKQMALLTQRNEIAAQQKLQTAHDYFEDDQYEKAIELYQELEYSNETLSELLIEEKQYALALDLDSNNLETIISALYEEDKKEEVLALSILDDNVQSQKLDIEKAIINNYREKLMAELPFVNDENTLLRAADMYLSEKDILSAEAIFQKTQSKLLRWKLDTKLKRIDIQSAEKELQAIKAGNAENKEDFMKTQQTKLATLKEQLAKLEQQKPNPTEKVQAMPSDQESQSTDTLIDSDS